jgi:hypothetical protein
VVAWSPARGRLRVVASAWSPPRGRLKVDGMAGTKLVVAEELADTNPYDLEYLRAVNMPA